jgi:hypothetical protein
MGDSCYEMTHSRESVAILAIQAISDSLIQGCHGTRLGSRIPRLYRALLIDERLSRDVVGLISEENGLYSRESSVRIILTKLPRLS